MSRTLLAMFSLAVLSSGCLPINDSVGDINKAEPDKELLGAWNEGEYRYVVDRPEVKGNPKGLMRVTAVKSASPDEEVKDENRLWFFVTEQGKHRYGNILLEQGKNYPEFARMGKEGEYAAWAKNRNRGFGIQRYRVEGDTLTVFEPDGSVLQELLKTEKFPEEGGILQAKPGWLTKYLETKEADKLFTGERKYKRVKK